MTKSIMYAAVQLSEIGQHCALQENHTIKVERQVLKATGAWLLRGRIGDVFDVDLTLSSPAPPPRAPLCA